MAMPDFLLGFGQSVSIPSVRTRFRWPSVTAPYVPPTNRKPLWLGVNPTCAFHTRSDRPPASLLPFGAPRAATCPCELRTGRNDGSSISPTSCGNTVGSGCPRTPSELAPAPYLRWTELQRVKATAATGVQCVPVSPWLSGSLFATICGRYEPRSSPIGEPTPFDGRSLACVKLLDGLRAAGHQSCRSLLGTALTQPQSSKAVH